VSSPFDRLRTSGRRDRNSSPLTKLASWIQSDDLLAMPPARFDRVKQHILDTIGAWIAGSRLEAGVAATRFAATIGDRVGSSIVAACAHARSTEIDDIHLTSLTTPGSVVVSTVLALASQRAHASTERSVRLRTVAEFGAAALAGYEAMIRFGVAIDGPTVLHRGVWPTHAAAAFGSAAAASRAYRLSVEETIGALATALAFGSGMPVSPYPANSSRWITLGIAAANGELAARAAREGLTAPEPANDVSAPLADGLRQTRNAGARRPDRCLFDDIGMKPYPTTRQGLAAIEAARYIAASNNIQSADIDAVTVGLPEVQQRRIVPADIDRIIVAVPELQRRVVDRAGMPTTRLESIVSVRYQVALAIVAPDRFPDVDRTPPFAPDDVRRLVSIVDVRRARDLDSYYPRAWPARVTIVAGRQRFTRTVIRPRGDARRPLGWDEVAEKFERLAAPAIGAAAARRTARTMQHATPDATMPRLWELTS
jgi:2-methylcitrate dehydratase PrpD